MEPRSMEKTVWTEKTSFPHSVFSTIRRFHTRRLFHTPSQFHTVFFTLRLFHSPSFPVLRVFHTAHVPSNRLVFQSLAQGAHTGYSNEKMVRPTPASFAPTRPHPLVDFAPSRARLDTRQSYLIEFSTVSDHLFVTISSVGSLCR